MSRPLRIKAPFVDAPTKSKPYRLIYGLGFTDYRINFILVSIYHLGHIQYII
jgi:hypothetical protein